MSNDNKDRDNQLDNAEDATFNEFIANEPASSLQIDPEDSLIGYDLMIDKRYVQMRSLLDPILGNEGESILTPTTLQDIQERMKGTNYTLARKVHNTLKNTLINKYEHLGDVAADDLLNSLALMVIDRCYNPPFRCSQHVLLQWPSGWVKSTILKRFSDLMPEGLCGEVVDTTQAPFRGSVNSELRKGMRFAPPTVLMNPIMISKEFGTMIGDDNSKRKILYSMLEDQEIVVSLLKLAAVSREEREFWDEQMGIEFHGRTSFRYKCQTVFWGANYESVDDVPLRSRLKITIPKSSLDDMLMHYIMYMEWKIVWDSDLEELYETVNDAVRDLLITHRPPINLVPVVDEFVDNRGLSFRDASAFTRIVMALQWWGQELTSENLDYYAHYFAKDVDVASKTVYDRINDLFKSDWHSMEDAAHILGCSTKYIRMVLTDTKYRDPGYIVKEKKDPSDGRKILRKIVHKGTKVQGRFSRD